MRDRSGTAGDFAAVKAVRTIGTPDQRLSVPVESAKEAKAKTAVRVRAPACAERGIALRSLREGIDTSNTTGRMVAGVLASLAEPELELGRERRSAAREARRARGQSIGRPKALSQSKAAFARKLHAQREPASIIAAESEVSRATIYRVLAEEAD
jgi:DNA invertase Pin-like site-specific DNA recombinase